MKNSITYEVGKALESLHETGVIGDEEYLELLTELNNADLEEDEDIE